MVTNSKIRAVIFDMDGVLTDSEPLINVAAIAMFRERGLQARPEDFLPFVGTGEDRYIGGVAALPDVTVLRKPPQPGRGNVAHVDRFHRLNPELGES